MRSIAQFCYRRRRYVLGRGLSCSLRCSSPPQAFAGGVHDRVQASRLGKPEAIDLLEESGVAERTGIQGQVVFQAEQGVDDPAVRRSVESLLSKISDSEIEGVEVAQPVRAGQ